MCSVRSSAKVCYCTLGIGTFFTGARCHKSRAEDVHGNNCTGHPQTTTVTFLDSPEIAEGVLWVTWWIGWSMFCAAGSARKWLGGAFVLDSIELRVCGRALLPAVVGVCLMSM